ncbi:MAG: copper-binding protein [Phycisphaerales bacterium JB039]
MLRTTCAARRLTAGLVCALAAGLCACGPGAETPEQAAPDIPAATGRQPDQIYTVRGQIVQLPDPENPAKALQIQHENIPDFINRFGEKSGMKPMAMPFTPAPGLDLSSLAIGAKVEFTFDVDWDGSPLFQVTAIEELPAETELDFTPPD